MTKSSTLFLFVILSLLISAPLSAQVKCGTVTTSKVLEAQQRFMPGYFGCEYINKHKRTLQITAHIARDTLGSTNYNENGLDLEIALLNSFWEPVGISFQVCDIRYMDNFQFDEFRQWEHESEMIAMYYQQNTINIYFVNSVTTTAAGVVGGYAILPGGPDFMVVDKESSEGTGDVIPHEMGHFFGLYHTFHDEFGIELVDGSNCETTGDLVCDTEANPSDEPEDFTAGCNYIGTPATDSNGEYYVPPGNNIMSYTDCGCRFTPQQYNRMLEQYLQLRSYLW